MKASSSSGRKIRLNIEQDLFCLETVLEVPVPEEIFVPIKGRLKRNGSSKFLSRSSSLSSSSRFNQDRRSTADLSAGRQSELQVLLGVAGAPLVPSPISSARKAITNDGIKNDPIEASMAKYIVKQYIAASGGEAALDSIESMYVMGRVRMISKPTTGHDHHHHRLRPSEKRASSGGAGGEMGCFVLWQKNPELWSLELVVSGFKICAGSDGRVAWRQTPWHPPHASRGPTRPLRRSLQGLDPLTTANLFSNSVCLGEKTVNGDACFVLRFDTEDSVLQSRSSNGVEIVRHTVWGCFSQRTGLLVRLEDSYMLRIRTGGTARGSKSVYWETAMESSIDDYRTIDGVSIAHSGRTTVALFCIDEDGGSVAGEEEGGGSGEEYGEGRRRTQMEEEWSIEEVDFNVQGLSMESFMPPGDLRDDGEGFAGEVAAKFSGGGDRKWPSAIRLPSFVRSGSLSSSLSSKVAAVVNVDDV